MTTVLSNNEITGWLKEVKNTALEFIFSGLLAHAEQELNVERRHTSQENITKGVMMV